MPFEVGFHLKLKRCGALVSCQVVKFWDKPGSAAATGSALSFVSEADVVIFAVGDEGASAGMWLTRRLYITRRNMLLLLPS